MKYYRTLFDDSDGGCCVSRASPTGTLRPVALDDPGGWRKALCPVPTNAVSGVWIDFPDAIHLSTSYSVPARQSAINSFGIL
jgi:hypothetical protein